MHVERDDAKRRLVVTPAGRWSVQEWTAHIDQQLADGAWHYSTLYDLRGLDLPGPTREEIDGMARYTQMLTRRHGPRGAVAVVVGPIAMLEVERFHATADEMPFRIARFHDLETATAWLDAQGESG